MNIQLQRPLAIFDLETTGINTVTDRIVEIAIVKTLPTGEQQRKRKLVNPQMPIPKGAQDIHGISDEMVKDAPTFKEIANEINQFLDNCDIGGYNSNKFDIPILVEEFLRVGLDFNLAGRKLVDVQKVFHKMEQRTLSAAYKFYCDKSLEDAHSAEADAMATWEVMQAQIERYPNIGNTIESILAFTGEEKFVDLSRRFILQNDIVVFNFGKHKGKSVSDVLKHEPQYYDWMMKGDFSLHTKQVISEILNQTLLKK
ncbi:MAG TPA: 3'-5' exonuclease [Arachidicoccus soli]|uniref:3'-5' exonuclease n=1 Tax=Arachidicoccus soli TaxID=2341117 RepID=A0A386HU96_9BACT|nr:3'-5' exonuclease [Arachidicoccus soli]AYD49000.1 3'-5' exonuclease [Arachidicoccus soli]HEU0226107.1 3'-5' exonuclease [Arachidicoccus soli]